MAERGEAQEAKRLGRPLEVVWHHLREAGVTALDHVGEPYDPGAELKVALVEQRAGVLRPYVQEALKPAVYYQGELVQMAEVVVCTSLDMPGDSEEAAQ